MTKKPLPISTGSSPRRTRPTNDRKAKKGAKRSGQLTAADIDILTYIAKFRLLTVTQMAALTMRSRQVIRRRLRYFQKQHLVVAQRREFGEGPGARENVLSVTDNALELLRSKGKIKRKKSGPKGKAPEALFIEHELFVNWFFIHLLHIQRVKPRLKVQPLITSSKRYITRRTNRKPMIARLSTNQKKSDL